VLVVDDDDAIRSALGRFLDARGFEVDVAESSEAALERLASRKYSLMLCDVRMPGISGMELVPQARDLDPDLAIMMLTAATDAPTAAEALSLGAMEYLTKPIELRDLEQAIDRVLSRRDLAVERRNVERLIRDEVARRTGELERERVVTLELAVQAISRMAIFREAQGPFFAGMTPRVTALARAIAEELQLSTHAIEQVTTAARLHDIGRIALRDAILDKPSTLTSEEVEHVRGHVQTAVEILTPLGHLGEVIGFVRDHHEHWDGTGYPDGRHGEEITIGGRILCAADAFIALTSKRPYRSAMTIVETLDFLGTHSGSLIEPAIYQALLKVVRGGRILGLTAD
jgi:putative nucleotidyltransferase with HDIG domain